MPNQVDKKINIYYCIRQRHQMALTWKRAYHGGKTRGPWSQTVSVHILAPPLTCSVTLDRLFNLCVSKLLPLKLRAIRALTL